MVKSSKSSQPNLKLATLKSHFSLAFQILEQFIVSRKRLEYFFLAILTVISLWFSQTQVSHAFGVRDRIQVIQLSRMSPEQEMQIGQKMNRDLLRSEFRLYRNPDIQDYVVEIGERLFFFIYRAY